MDIKRILPLEINFKIKNFSEFIKRGTLEENKNNKERTIFFLDAATYNNLGDQAIALAIKIFVQYEFPDYKYVEVDEKNCIRNIRCLKNIIKDGDIICLSGGGNMGNLYPRYEAIRRIIIKNFKKNKIIVFPQTIDYEDSKYGKKSFRESIKVYNSNSNLVVCARESKSYGIMSKSYKNTLLVPDIVFYLYDKIKINLQQEHRNTIGICLREDKESIFGQIERKKIINELSRKYNIVELTTMSEEKQINSDNREEILAKKLDEFSKCKIIVTDRLHGMIFSILCNVPCIAFDNSNKKVSGVFNTVQGYFDETYFMDKVDVEFICNMIEKLDCDNTAIKKCDCTVMYGKLIQEMKGERK